MGRGVSSSKGLSFYFCLLCLFLFAVVFSVWVAFVFSVREGSDLGLVVVCALVTGGGRWRVCFPLAYGSALSGSQW